MFALEHLFAGAGPLLLHWGVGVAAIILLVAGAWFSPVFKKDFLYAAIIVAIALLFEGVGVHDEAARCKAQQQVVIKYVDKAVKKTRTPASHRAVDRWDNRSN